MYVSYLAVQYVFLLFLVQRTFRIENTTLIFMHLFAC